MIYKQQVKSKRQQVGRKLQLSVWKRDAGFTLVELMIAMVVFVLTIAAASAIFVPLLTQFKQQSKIAETQIHGVTGLDAMRRDIEQAGLGLPWILDGVNYNEATSGLYNDSPSNPPRAILSGNNTGPNASDYLVIKSTIVAPNNTATKWTDVRGLPGGGNSVTVWGNPLEDLTSTDSVTVIYPTTRKLKNSGAAFSTTISGAGTPAASVPTAFSPDARDTFVIYGVAPGAVRMPFNRADYYISTVNVPQRCAPGTGVLVKAVVSQADGSFSPYVHPDATQSGGILSLLDCVANFQVAYGRDTTNGGTINNRTDDISALSAQEIHDQVKEVRVYILAQEGQRDTNYAYPSNIVALAPADDPAAASVGTRGDGTVDISGITNWQNYRWQAYTIVVKPKNLR